ncbi:MAG: FAD-dependent oxidoreductase, partial [Alphaproteobacteria bacterium]
TMASVIRSGGQDMIGAARPSIADPFLPKKIEQGRSEDIRECIGCNICYAHDSLGVPIRCTQNPTMGEEWRMGWHPERVPAAHTLDQVLVIGGGPAGLEAARVLGEAGYSVMLAEASRTFGGRVSVESKLPGLSEWARVRDWRLGQLGKLDNVQLFPESPMTAKDILGLEVDHVLFATGSTWAADTVGRHSASGLSEQAPSMLISAETVLRGEKIEAEHVLIYDDDHYYMGSVIALALKSAGHRVTLVTSAGRPCEYGVYTGEIYASNARLFEAGVEVVTNKMVTALEPGHAVAECTMSGRVERLECDLMIPVCRRLPNLALHDDFARLHEQGEAAAVRSFARIGDANAPNTIAAAVYAGYRAGVELGKSVDLAEVYGRREHPPAQ